MSATEQQQVCELRIWWIPQVPMGPFHVAVRDVVEANLIYSTLSAYDAFQFENNVKGDYCNVGGLETLEDGEWVEWEDPDSGECFSDWRHSTAGKLAISAALTPRPIGEGK